jgi:hypothetical protein
MSAIRRACAVRVLPTCRMCDPGRRQGDLQRARRWSAAHRYAKAPAERDRDVGDRARRNSCVLGRRIECGVCEMIGVYVACAVLAFCGFVWWWFRPPKEKREQWRSSFDPIAPPPPPPSRYEALTPWPAPPAPAIPLRGGVRSHVAGTKIHGKPKPVREESAPAPVDNGLTTTLLSSDLGAATSPTTESSFSGGGGDFGGGGASGGYDGGSSGGSSCSSPSSCGGSSGCGGGGGD